MKSGEHIYFMGWTHMIGEIGLDEFIKRVKKEIEASSGLLTEAAASWMVWNAWKLHVIKNRE